MARFRYALQVALDDAAANERDGKVALGNARGVLAEHERALATLQAHAVATRAELTIGGALPASLYVEVGRRLEAVASAERACRARIAQATRTVGEASASLAQLAQRRKAIERHRERKREEFDARQVLREAAEFDESNAQSDSRVIRA